MYQISHIAAFWLQKAMTIPGGAANPDVELRVIYWPYICHYNTARRLSGGYI